MVGQYGYVCKWWSRVRRGGRGVADIAGFGVVVGAGFGRGRECVALGWWGFVKVGREQVAWEWVAAASWVVAGLSVNCGGCAGDSNVGGLRVGGGAACSSWVATHSWVGPTPWCHRPPARDRECCGSGR